MLFEDEKFWGWNEKQRNKGDWKEGRVGVVVMPFTEAWKQDGDKVDDRSIEQDIKQVRKKRLKTLLNRDQVAAGSGQEIVLIFSLQVFAIGCKGRLYPSQGRNN